VPVASTNCPGPIFTPISSKKKKKKKKKDFNENRVLNAPDPGSYQGMSGDTTQKGSAIPAANAASTPPRSCERSQPHQ
jgi:hypothetical protein